MSSAMSVRTFANFFVEDCVSSTESSTSFIALRTAEENCFSPWIPFEGSVEISYSIRRAMSLLRHRGVDGLEHRLGRFPVERFLRHRPGAGGAGSRMVDVSGEQVVEVEGAATAL